MPMSVDWKSLRERAIDLDASGSDPRPPQARSAQWPSQEAWARLTWRQKWKVAKACLPPEEYRRQSRLWWANLLDPEENARQPT